MKRFWNESGNYKSNGIPQIPYLSTCVNIDPFFRSSSSGLITAVGDQVLIRGVWLPVILIKMKTCIFCSNLQGFMQGQYNYALHNYMLICLPSFWYYSCWGNKKKNLLNASKCNDEEWEFYEKHKSMFRCKRERNMHVMHLTTQWQAWEKKIDMSLVFVFCLDLCADNDPLVLMHLV